MKNCGKCGAPLEDSAKFCEKCGTPQMESPAAVPDVQPEGASITETIEGFRRTQSKTVETLRSLLDFLKEAERCGVDFDPSLKRKLAMGIAEREDEKLKVVLIGGFSEGKTAIAAAWAERYDKSTMKISQSESSDAVVEYSTDEFDIIDTPGLFGFKETTDKEKYKDITKKYVSEAHLVLYVMNPNNPVKESHREDLLWLFKDLGLLSRTVFVIGRFDEEVDIEDDDDYRKGLAIKRGNILGRLRDFGIITSTEEVPIVAVSANPFEKGLDYWLSRLPEYKRLSRIWTLQKATADKIRQAGSQAAIIEASKHSIINDVLTLGLPIAVERDKKVSAECERLAQVCDATKAELEKTRADLNRARATLREFVVRFFTDLILQVKGTDMETIGDFFERNIGSEGVVLNTHIKTMFEKQLGVVFHTINAMEIALDSDIQQYNTVMGGVVFTGLKEGGKLLSGGANITAAGIKAARDFVLPALKFKPWEAVKLAGNLNKAIPIVGQVIGIGVEVWDSLSQAQKEAKFQKAVAGMVANFEEQRKEYLALLDDDARFLGVCCPQYNRLQEEIAALSAEFAAKKQRSEDFRKWREQGETIKTEFHRVMEGKI